LGKSLKKASIKECLDVEAEIVMSTPPITVDPSTPLWEAARKMYENNIGSILIVDEKGKLSGIITRRDLLYLLASGIAARNPAVGAVMSTSVITASPKEPVMKILGRMRRLGIRHIPVVDDDMHPLGVISLWDLANLILSCIEDALEEHI
jgi:CBS domain-containing protein